MATTGIGIEAKIGADISDLKNKIAEADRLLISYQNEIEKTAKKVLEASNKSELYEKAIQRLNNSFKSGKTSQTVFKRETERLTGLLSKADNDVIKYSRELDRLERQLNRADRSTENLTSSTQDYANSTQRVSRDTRQMSGQINTFGNTTRENAVPAMQSFSQIIQDSPYGIQGVANNIQQLTAQFGFLSNRAGGAKAAFQAMIGSLTGPAGILLAVSAVTTVLVAYGDEILNAINGTSKFSGELRKAAGSVQGELATMQALLAVARDENSERQKRIDAIKILNEQYPELNGQIKLETINTKATTTAIEAATKAIEERAKMRAAESLISTEAEKLFQKQAELEKEREVAIQESLNARVQSFKKYSRGIGTASLDLAKTRQEIEERVNKEYDERLEDAEKKYRDYVKRLGEIIKNAPNLLSLFGEEGALTEEIQKQVDKEEPVSLPVDLSLPANLDEIFAAPDIGTTPDIQGPGLDVEQMERNIQKVKEMNVVMEAYKAQLKSLQNVATVVTSGIGSAFSTMAQQISSNLETGNAILDAFVSGMVQSLARIAAAALQSLITEKIIGTAKIQVKRAEASANAITAASAAAAAAGPLGVALLPGLIAGALATVQGSFAAIQAFAHGGIVGGGSFSGDRVPILANSGEMILNDRQQANLFKMLDGRIGALQSNQSEVRVYVEGSISGENINLSQTRYLRNRSRRN